MSISGITGVAYKFDKRRKLMKEILEACELAGVGCPPEVREYFNSNPFKFPEIDLFNCITPIEDPNDELICHELDLARVPNHIRYIRIYEKN